ncbi:hypothetical protein RKD55_004673 [Rossellomorea marisflavi]
MIQSAFPSTTPCGNLFFIPPKIFEYAIQQDKQFVFVVPGSDIHQSYIVTFSPEKTNNLALDYLYSAATDEAVALFSKLPWPEGEMEMEDAPPHIFFYKEAPSIEAVKDYFSKR